jgi:hypothetical protein
MEDIFHDMSDLEVYINDVGIFANSKEHSLRIQDEVLHQLETDVFTVNLLKCERMVQETDWLGHWLTPDGLKPWKKKVNTVLCLQPPNNVKQVQSLVGSVTYYHDMFP